ncbi:L-lactate dehydrogenase [Spiroplasma platyhelix]|uniref:L-lactate dehydrogenase n=1 Tax=Spiroplasma platyhelix PALS-1 TaxID=1276218 RepID=A0A846U0G3_9MOLU|nr:L-lactate dehydrogenase [Spiroplasma platyhelix]MBE4703953.1 L-lactate dehydrogenase [Spiroplasma platyhelix PALS-1]NKE38326.1 L-lactate dehydrogenase [Spiroplasma platyhelix PALS-1]UJB29211.1 L-lactate dehydrogenase [Spiroplasma platyhelix PALS-1]
MKRKKIVLIGCGSVGNSFIYSCINQGLAEEYVLIDMFKEFAEGNAIDFSDTQASLPNSFASIKAGDYPDCKDADIVVITAGRPQKPGETRLNMVADNAKIMQDIALKIKSSGFNGITLIASNPVDIMTTVYQKVTGFDIHKVIGSGTILDTARLRFLLSQKLNVSPKSISAYVIAEHGDSSFIPWSCTTVANKTINQLIAEKLITKEDLNEIEQQVRNRAYEIINLKKATFYGIAAALASLVKIIYEDQNTISIAGGYLEGQYENSGFYVGVPMILNLKGWKKVIQLPLTEEEQEKFAKSCQIIKETLDTAYQAINMNLPNNETIMKGNTL